VFNFYFTGLSNLKYIDRSQLHFIMDNERAYKGLTLGALQRRVAATMSQILYIYMAHTNSSVARLSAKYFGSDVARFFCQWRSKVF
jgi:hypothetical protein